MRAVNVPMRAVLSLPFATPLSANLMLISYTGREVGKAYRQPVSYVRDGETLLTPGGGRWTLNLHGRPAGPAPAARPRRARPRRNWSPTPPRWSDCSASSPRGTRGRPVHPDPAPPRRAPRTRRPRPPRCGTASASSAGTSRSGDDSEGTSALCTSNELESMTNTRVTHTASKGGGVRQRSRGLRPPAPPKRHWPGLHQHHIALCRVI